MRHEITNNTTKIDRFDEISVRVFLNDFSRSRYKYYCNYDFYFSVYIVINYFIFSRSASLITRYKSFLVFFSFLFLYYIYNIDGEREICLKQNLKDIPHYKSEVETSKFLIINQLSHYRIHIIKIDSFIVPFIIFSKTIISQSSQFMIYPYAKNILIMIFIFRIVIIYFMFNSRIILV